MQLKPYQNAVLADLENYLEILANEKNLSVAWEKYQGASENRYNDRINGVPNVCLKIPTGGGKTFLACSSLKKIFDTLPSDKKFVVWLVPNDAILTQTLAALSDSEHPYRQKINADFQGKVIVYDKEMILQAQNFSSATIPENLSICVMSYASIRIDSRKKDARKVHQENGSLETVADFLGTENTALINILQELRPVVIVDESHNTKSDLSVEMLENLNPRFILELTATPKSFSNIISVVESKTLDANEMVKLPIIVYNPQNKENLIESVINHRNHLEELAASDKEKYIRPIALFQAQPNTEDNSETFEKIREDLVKAGIPKNQIAIKTANINEIGDKDLMAADCPIRYIITINALKEGWDCPFAYILASLANKNSATDVEQLVGRILRQPYTIKSANKFLNSAYVFTCSEAFDTTVKKIVTILNGEGFNDTDVKNAEDYGAQNTFEQAEKAIEHHNGENKTSVDSQRGLQMQTYKVKENFRAEIENLLIPQFFQMINNGTADRLLTPENLSEGFNLNEQDKKIQFDINIAEIAIEDNQFISSLLSMDRAQEYQSMLDSKTPEEQRNYYSRQIFYNLRHWKRTKAYSMEILRKYIADIVANMHEDEFANLNLKTLPIYTAQIKDKISALDNTYRKENFDNLIRAGKIFCKANYKLKDSIQIGKANNTIKKRLYESEGDMNNFELNLISKVAGLDNVKWWHRIIERQDFVLNGFINHYPDFLVMLNSGKIILVEAKGEHLKNDDSHEKLELGKDWQNCAGQNYKYFMVFDDSAIQDRNSCTANTFLQIISEL